ncbi:MAG: hydrogenase, partial [Gemmatimonadota bacterium]
VALGNVVFDMGRFGIQFVASPRHADGIVITGAVSRNMRYALERTYEAVPDPRIVIAVGACAASGGPFRGSTQVGGGVPDAIPVDLWVPGCPPHPLTLLDGLLRLLGRLHADGRVGVAS